MEMADSSMDNTWEEAMSLFCTSPFKKNPLKSEVYIDSFKMYEWELQEMALKDVLPIPFDRQRVERIWYGANLINWAEQVLLEKDWKDMGIPLRLCILKELLKYPEYNNKLT